MLERALLQYSSRSVQTNLPIKSDRINLEEIKEAYKSLKLGRASDCDNSITAEAIKNGGPFIQETIHRICNQVFTDYNAAKKWTTNIIIPLPTWPKNGDLSLIMMMLIINYRGISLMSISATVYKRILLNISDMLSIQSCDKIRQDLEKQEAVQIKSTSLQESWKELGTNNCQFLLHILIFGIDRIDRMMRQYGIPEKIVRTIRLLYDNSWSFWRKNAKLLNPRLTKPFL